MQNSSENNVSTGSSKHMLPAVPTADDVFLSAKYFIVDKAEECIWCFISERNGGWDGYKLAIKYLHGDGYSWQLSGFWAANSNVEYMIEQKPNMVTKDKFKAASMLGLCPKCSALLFDEFTNALHNVQKCGSPKRAVAPKSEWA